MTDTSQAYTTVLRWLDAEREALIAFAQELIRIPSVNPYFDASAYAGGEAAVQTILGRRLAALGGSVETWEPDADALAIYAGRPGYYAGRSFRGRPNQAVTLTGTGGGRSLLLTGHVDVVPPGAGWTVDPFAGVRSEGQLYGRGAVDMKGGLAAMVLAIEAIHRCGYRTAGDLLVGTVVDEEAGGMGTLDFVAQGYRADAALLAESTDFAVAPLCRGILWGKLIIPGRSGHIELPQGDWRKGGSVDAIALARIFMDHFDRLNQDWALRKRHRYLPTPCQVYVAQILGGEYPTAFANRVELVFNAQYLPAEKDEMGLGSRVKGELEAFIAAIAATEPWLQLHPPTVEWMIDADCGETASDDPFVETVVDAIASSGRRAEIEGVSAHTDMGWFVNVGIPTINFGGGKARLAHQSDEHIAEQDILDTAKVIALTIMKWCGITQKE